MRHTRFDFRRQSPHKTHQLRINGVEEDYMNNNNLLLRRYRQHVAFGLHTYTHISSDAHHVMTLITVFYLVIVTIELIQ